MQRASAFAMHDFSTPLTHVLHWADAGAVESAHESAHGPAQASDAQTHALMSSLTCAEPVGWRVEQHAERVSASGSAHSRGGPESTAEGGDDDDDARSLASFARHESRQS